MIISIIVAVASNNVIGKNNTLPWHLPADMKYFKETTSGHCVITGRKNYESIPEKFRPLQGRTNIVITRNKELRYDGVIMVHSLQEAIAEAMKKNETEVFIIGGGEIFKEAVSLADKIYLTRIHHTIDGDIFFPEINPDTWIEANRTDRMADEKNKYNYSFLVYTRKK
jgi:dihydrofolate reductase